MLNFPIGDVGFSKIALPVIEIGKGKSIVSIIAGIHGDETSSLLVIDRLLKNLPGKINTKIRIILSANPFATMQRRRENISDNLDLNRAFPGNPEKTITERIANKILEAIKDSDAVIDLHCFEIQTPLMAIVVESKNPTLNKKNLSLIKKFSPKQCWIIDSSRSEEAKFGKSLGTALNDLDIPNFAVELNNPEVIEEKEVDACASGILRVLKSSSQEKNPNSRFNRFFERNAIHACHEGIFTPKAKLLSKLKKEQLIGTIKTFPDFKTIKVTSKISGTLMQICRKKFVFLGQEIAAIGTIKSRKQEEK